MKFLQFLMKFGKPLSLVLIPLGVVSFIARFLYGRANEMGTDGELHLTTTGILLSVIAVFCVVVGLFLWVVGSKK